MMDQKQFDALLYLWIEDDMQVFIVVMVLWLSLLCV